ncbi:MAG: hypothetical protein LRZ84_04890 [Desertifilum sp.]|nr:hypothetical protein [Desertifilum sp.]
MWIRGDRAVSHPIKTCCIRSESYAAEVWKSALELAGDGSSCWLEPRSQPEQGIFFEPVTQAVNLYGMMGEPTRFLWKAYAEARIPCWGLRLRSLSLTRGNLRNY